MSDSEKLENQMSLSEPQAEFPNNPEQYVHHFFVRALDKNTTGAL